MRSLATVVAAAVAVSAFGVAQAANTYSEPPGSSSFGSAVPPPAGTQEWVYDPGFGGAYHWDNPSFGRTIATADPGPSTTFVTDNYNQIRPNLRINAGTPLGGDVDLFKVTVADPNTFQLWTGRGPTANTMLLTLFATDGTAIAASYGGVQVGNTSVVAYTAASSAAPVNMADPGIINGASLGISAGDYIVAVSNLNVASGKGQPKNDAGQNLFNPVAGSVVTPNALGDLKLSTDPLKGWDLYTLDGGTVGSYDLGVDQLLSKSSFTSGSSSYINVFIPEPGTMSIALAAGALVLRRRNRA